MLPELLFAVGSSMQDISRDDFHLLNSGGCEKDEIVNITSSSPPLCGIIPETSNHIIINDCNSLCNSLQCTQNNLVSSNSEQVANIKLEDSNNSDLYSSTALWHHPHHSEITATSKAKLLLKNSDDPLISRGAASMDDDNPHELKSIIAANSNATMPLITTLPITSNVLNSNTKQSKKSNTKKSKTSSTPGSGQTRTRKKGAFKLRFHHQALPAEYLSHYEETQNQLEARNAAAAAAATAAIATAINNNNNTVVNLNNKNNKKTVSASVPAQSNQNKLAKSTITSHENVRNWLQKIAEMQATAKENTMNSYTNKHIESMELEDNLIGGKYDLSTHSLSSCNSSTIPQQKHLLSTLRAPSNQRVIKYSDLPYMGEMTLENSKPRRGRKPKKADICHLIYKNYGTIFPGTPKGLMGKLDGIGVDENSSEHISLLKKTLIGQDHKDANGNIVLGEEPLNLCLRDQSESLTISSDGYESDDIEHSISTTPLLPLTPTEDITDTLLAANLKMSLPNFQSALSDKSQDNMETTTSPSIDEIDPKNSWPNVNGIFIHPMALYYQKMVDNGKLTASTKPEVSSGISNKKPLQLLTKPSIKVPSPKLTMKKEKLEYPDTCSTPNSIKSINSSSAATAISSSSQSQQVPQKRKRSAIFIPPMPAENTTNPATEVSICKFKFTGGAKPSLQEKKMLSVDSDGNYRYYSGTGDKSTRGYEFFPRESLQQSGVIPGVNCSGAFLNATGEKISYDIPPPSTGLSNELLQIPDTPPSLLLRPTGSSTRDHHHHHSHIKSVRHSSSSSSNDRRKRKSRRSLQREKLEQTFKDKGFLIQTQQLESAEGATYCKFRQLKKFTRYLFRSWKDYLPGDLPAGMTIPLVDEAGNTHNLKQPASVTPM